MKTLLISSLFVIGAYSGVAQNFTRHTTIASGGADTRYIQWVNFDNDSLLEVVVMWMDAAQSGHITFYRNNSTTLSPVDTIDTGLSGITEFLVTDVDSDNAIDLVVSGMAGNNPSTMAFLNKGNFDFQADTLVSRKASVIAFADLDQDGGHEMLISGADTAGYFHIYQRHGTLWELVADTFAIAALTIQTYDFDNDTDTDFFVSGTDGDGAEVSAIFYNRRGFVFEKRGTGTIAGHSSVSDLDHDGLLDVLVAGDSGTAVLFNKRETLEARDSLPVLGNPIVFTGDMTSDGRCDLSMLGTAITGTRMHIIARSDGSYDTLAADGIVTQAFGDFDADGDLDVAHVTDGVLVDSITVSLNGTAETNEKPGAPFNATGEVIFDKLFLQWQKPLDDHTESASLTYDVTIRAMGKNIVTAGFDSATTRRKVVSHGNAGTANYMLLDTQASGFSYSIQAVDNAYVGSDLCKGGGISCGSVVVADTIEACRNEVIVLEGSSAALWFSFRTGFIGEAQSLNVIAAETDTIFSVTPGATGEICAFITVYTIQLRHSLKKVTDATRYVCRGQSIELTADAGFQASWSSFRKGFLSNEATLTFTVTETDTVKLHLSDGSGCDIVRRTAVVPSEPVLELDGTAYQIVRGESVQLSAGGGESYTWAPAAGLSSTTIADPVASPSATTQYTVTITDSLGCTASGNVLVVVEQTAFVPNLFTPNADGKNDALKVYGLAQASGFRFSVFNREGNEVYSTASTNEVSSSGWDGTTRGISQPAGVYFWRVEGISPTGARILLNGKTSGSLVLIR